MPTINIYCANPLGKPNHNIKKTWFFKKVNHAFFEKYSNKVPTLELKKWLCVGCKIEIETMPLIAPSNCLVPGAAENGSNDNNDDLPLSSSSSSVSSIDAPSDGSLDAEIQVSEAEEKLKAITRILEIKRFCRNSTKRERLTDADECWGNISKAVLNLLLLTSDYEEQNNAPKRAERDVSCRYCTKLIHDLRARFVEVKTKAEKYQILTTLPAFVTIDAVVANFNCSQYMAREASKLRLGVGAFCRPVFKGREGLSELVKSSIRDFYLSTDNSRVNPAVRGTIMVSTQDGTTRVAEAKRLIMLTLSDLYSEFCNNHPEIEVSLSAFSLLRPQQCIWAGGKGFQNTCTCATHQNFELVLNACRVSATLGDIFSRCFCDSNSEKCMLGLCSECPKPEEIEKLFLNIEDEEMITYNFWGLVDGQYGTQLQTLSKPLAEFQQLVTDLIPNVAAHHFVMKKQQAFIADLRNQKLQEENSGIMHLDFAQNYAFLYPNEIQSFYYTNKQATIHPCVFSWYSQSSAQVKTKSYVVISDDLNHNATTVHAFIAKVLDKIKVSHPSITKIYYISDGAASQYKNAKNFANLLFHKLDYGLDAEWHFTATSHGKGQCDAMGAVTKRSLRLASLKIAKPGEPQTTISTALDMYRHCTSKLSSITLEYLLVSAKDIEVVSKDHKLQQRYALADRIPGTRSHHSFVPVSENEIKIKRFSLSETSRTVNVTKTIHPVSAANVGQYVGIRTEKQFAVGMITEVDAHQLEYTIQIMQRKGKGNSFSWYEPCRSAQIHFDDVVKIIEAPTPTTSTGRYYRLLKTDFDALKSFKRVKEQT